MSSYARIVNLTMTLCVGPMSKCILSPLKIDLCVAYKKKTRLKKKEVEIGKRKREITRQTKVRRPIISESIEFLPIYT